MFEQTERIIAEIVAARTKGRNHIFLFAIAAAKLPDILGKILPLGIFPGQPNRNDPTGIVDLYYNKLPPCSLSMPLLSPSVPVMRESKQ